MRTKELLQETIDSLNEVLSQTKEIDLDIIEKSLHPLYILSEDIFLNNIRQNKESKPPLISVGEYKKALESLIIIQDNTYYLKSILNSKEYFNDRVNNNQKIISILRSMIFEILYLGELNMPTNGKILDTGQRIRVIVEGVNEFFLD
jgi:hypothetical protein